MICDGVSYYIVEVITGYNIILQEKLGWGLRLNCYGKLTIVEFRDSKNRTAAPTKYSIP